MCAIARWRARSRLHGDAGVPAMAPAVDERVDTFWHTGPCRFCDVPYEELLKTARLVTTLSNAERKAWEDLGPKGRLARIREVQRREWWDELTDKP